MGITLGMDAINSEKNNGTLSRLISQPIYRDNIINAKFLAGVGVIAVLMTSAVLIVTGMAMNLIGIPPTAEEAWRLLFFLIVSIIYGSFWLGLAILMSTLFKQVAVSAIVCIAIWLAFALFFPLILNNMFASIDPNLTVEAASKQIQSYINISRISPIQLFQESMSMILAPGARTMSQMLLAGNRRFHQFCLEYTSFTGSKPAERLAANNGNNLTDHNLLCHFLYQIHERGNQSYLITRYK